jgi:hypothetical protein
MKLSHIASAVIVLATCLFAISMMPVSQSIAADNGSPPPAWFQDSVGKLRTELVAKYGNGQQSRLDRGLRQVGQFWREEDGKAPVFEAFVRANFAGDQKALDTLFSRYSRMLEILDGHMAEIHTEFRLQSDLDHGPVLPFDEAFAAYDPTAHVNDDFFANKLAFVVLLNFPLTTLDQRLAEGEHWSRRQWAETRLADRFAKRVPAEVIQGVAKASSDAGLYITQYFICMHHLLDAAGQRPFPPELRLVAHWNLRDEIKSQYANGAAGLARQRMIQKVMERIVDQSIPQFVIDNQEVDWNPVTNVVDTSKLDIPVPSPCDGSPYAEPNTRYAKLLAVFQANRKIDPYSPTAPTFIARRFAEDRQMSEARVKAMLEAVLTSPQFAEVGRLVEKRLGRPLEPFDIWYDGFLPRQKYGPAELDKIVRQRYPTAEAYRADMPNILMKLGFSRERAKYLRDSILVEPSRGPGHANGGTMRGQKARLRTRVEAGGMNYKGFNIAVHEMGHNIEQTFSLNMVDDRLLAGVPNNSFTEALAMVCQGHDLEILGLTKPDARSEALRTLSDFWATAEISGVALVDMAVWHWMYDHPDAKPADLKAAVLELARGVWNRYYAPVFHQRDSTLLAIYSHMICESLYLPDYPIGHMIGFQVEEHIKKTGQFGTEYERMTTYGSLLPDMWMKNATGAPVGPDALLRATQQALGEVAK